MKWMVLLLSLSTACLAAQTCAPVLADHGGGSPATLRAAVRDLMDDFGPEYPAGEEYLRQLDAIEQQMVSGTEGARAAFERLQRAALLANPLVRTQPILFVVREQYLPDHHNTETIFHTGEPNCGKYRPGGPLKILDALMGRTSVLLDPGPEGLVRDPEVHFDGSKVIFSMRNVLPADKPIRHSPDLNELVMGLYLVDTFGNEVLLHSERPGCFDPRPLAAHPRPPVVQSLVRRAVPELGAGGGLAQHGRAGAGADQARVRHGGASQPAGRAAPARPLRRPPVAGGDGPDRDVDRPRRALLPGSESVSAETRPSRRRVSRGVGDHPSRTGGIAEEPGSRPAGFSSLRRATSAGSEIPGLARA